MEFELLFGRKLSFYLNIGLEWQENIGELNMPQNQAAQNQHYVPKFILRNFLSDPKKERVCVFSKKSGKGFTTSIKNILAERRFYEFLVNESYLASFEKSIGRVENLLLPVYRSVIASNGLDGTRKQKEQLARLVAFQFVRTRSMRDQFQDLESKLEHLADLRGFSLEDFAGHESLTGDKLGQLHINFMINMTDQLADVIASKDFFLLRAPKGRRFYLSDNPVSIHNSERQDGLLGNMGFECKGIEVYMPLSSDLQLCAWCPSILEGMRDKIAQTKRALASAMLSPAMTNVANPDLLKGQLKLIRTEQNKIENHLNCAKQGVPVLVSSGNMDFQNSLQVHQAREYIICQKADFDLAKRLAFEHPNSRDSPILFS